MLPACLRAAWLMCVPCAMERTALFSPPGQHSAGVLWDCSNNSRAALPPSILRGDITCRSSELPHRYRPAVNARAEESAAETGCLNPKQRSGDFPERCLLRRTAIWAKSGACHPQGEPCCLAGQGKAEARSSHRGPDGSCAGALERTPCRLESSKPHDDLRRFFDRRHGTVSRPHCRNP
jgi:hypothetical protein